MTREVEIAIERQSPLSRSRKEMRVMIQTVAVRLLERWLRDGRYPEPGSKDERIFTRTTKLFQREGFPTVCDRPREASY